MEKILKSYRILGLQPGASASEIKKAYRDMVKLWHPDQFAGDAQKRDEAELKLREINLAFETLQDANPSFDLLAALQSAYGKNGPSSAHRPPTTPHPPATHNPPPPGAPASHVRPRPAPPPRSRPQRRTQRPAPNTAQNQPRRSMRHSRLERFFGRSPAPAFAAGAGLLAVITAVAFWLSPDDDPAFPQSNEPFVSIADITSKPFTSSDPGHPSAGIVPSEISAPNPEAFALPEPDDAPTQPPRSLQRSGPKVIPRAIRETNLVALQTNGPAEPRVTNSSTLELVKELKAAKLSAEPTPPVESSEPEIDKAEMHFQQGVRYANGIGLLQDHAEAAKWYRLAAEAGHVQAQRNLGFLYAAGKGVPQDYTEAAKWLKKASAQSELQVASALLSAMAKSQSESTPSPDISDDIKHQAEQNFRRGRQYATGSPVPQDFVQAAKWYLLAAEAGHAEAQKHLGYLYVSGKGVRQDYAEAEKWLRKAEAQGATGVELATALLSANRTNTVSPSGPQNED